MSVAGGRCETTLYVSQRNEAFVDMVQFAMMYGSSPVPTEGRDLMSARQSITNESEQSGPRTHLTSHACPSFQVYCTENSLLSSQMGAPLYSRCTMLSQVLVLPVSSCTWVS